MDYTGETVTLRKPCWSYANSKLTKQRLYEMSCTIWYHFYNFKNVKYTHGIVLPLGKLHAKVLVKVTILHGYFSR